MKIHKNQDRFVTIEEKEKILKYQEKMNLCMENIANTSQKIQRSIY